MAQRDERARTNDAVATAVAEVARNLLELELPIETIIKATGLTHDEIEKLTQ